MSLDSSSLDEEDHSVVYSQPRRVTEGFLRDICTYGHIVGISPSVFKYYERIDGSPVLPGVDWDFPTDEGKKKWIRSFVKTTWRNTKNSMLLRRKFLKRQVDKHTNSLPRDFSISDHLRPRRSVLRSQGRYPELPKWTKEHYESQFRSAMASNIDFEALKAQVCYSHIGRATLVGAQSQVDDQLVNWHVKCQPDSSGFCVFECDGVQVQAKRVPRGRTLSQRSLDVFDISVVHGDTSRPTTYISKPFSLGDDRQKIFFSVTTSLAIQAQYAQERAEKLGDGPGVEAMVMSERALYTSLVNDGQDREKTFCVEFDGVEFIPLLLQDPELATHFDSPISCELMVAEGETEHEDVPSPFPFVAIGFNFTLAIDGRSDLLDQGESKTAFITKKMKDFSISGACV